MKHANLVEEVLGVFLRQDIKFAKNTALLMRKINLILNQNLPKKTKHVNVEMFLKELLSLTIARSSVILVVRKTQLAHVWCQAKDRARLILNIKFKFQKSLPAKKYVP